MSLKDLVNGTIVLHRNGSKSRVCQTTIGGILSDLQTNRFDPIELYDGYSRLYDSSLDIVQVCEE